MNRGTVLLRVDGSASGGLGRVARCLALANALQRRRYQMTFLSQLENHTWPDRIRRFRHTITRVEEPAGSDADADHLYRETLARRPVMVITDSPNINARYLERIHGLVPLVITLTDDTQGRHVSDLVLHPSVCHAAREFSVANRTQVLAGGKYVMIRAEFRRARSIRGTEPGGGTRVLLALGGGRTTDDTHRLASSLLKQKRIERIDAVLGCDSPPTPELTELAAASDGKLTLAQDVRDLGIRMTKAHLLITSGGNTALEASCVGIPMLLVPRRPEHLEVAINLDEHGVGQLVGPMVEVSGEQVAEAAVSVLEDNFERRIMSRSGRMFVDGRGADRMVTAAEVLLCRARKARALLAA